jgi:hypothetical protein
MQFSPFIYYFISKVFREGLISLINPSHWILMFCNSYDGTLLMLRNCGEFRVKEDIKLTEIQ